LGGRQGPPARQLHLHRSSCKGQSELVGRLRRLRIGGRPGSSCLRAHVAKRLNSLNLFLRQTVSKFSKGEVDYHAKFREEREALLAAVRNELAAGH